MSKTESIPVARRESEPEEMAAYTVGVGVKRAGVEEKREESAPQGKREKEWAYVG